MQIGDVVYLKSGGFAMTITDTPSQGSWGVHWVVGGTLQGATFPETSLTADDPTAQLAANSAAAAAKVPKVP